MRGPEKGSIAEAGRGFLSRKERMELEAASRRVEERHRVAAMAREQRDRQRAFTEDHNLMVALIQDLTREQQHPLGKPPASPLELEAKRRRTV